MHARVRDEGDANDDADIIRAIVQSTLEHTHATASVVLVMPASVLA